MFFDGSRYLRVKNTTAPGPGASTRTIKRIRVPAPVREAITYRVREGDRLDLLAFQFYRTPRKWWLIADANPQVLRPDELLKPGTILSIPKDESR